MMLDFIEENKATFLLVGCVFLSITLITIIIFIELPVGIMHILSLAAILLITGSFIYYFFDGIKSMWEMPELEAWEWILVVGILGSLVMMFVMMSFNISTFDMTALIPLPGG